MRVTRINAGLDVSSGMCSGRMCNGALHISQRSRLAAAINEAAWAGLKEDTIIIPTPGFGRFSAPRIPGNVGNCLGSQNIAGCTNNQPRRPSSKPHSMALGVFGTDRSFKASHCKQGLNMRPLNVCPVHPGASRARCLRTRQGVGAVCAEFARVPCRAWIE